MIRISPLDQIISKGKSYDDILSDWSGYASDYKIKSGIGEFALFRSGKDCIRHIMEKESFKKEDEVFITTTTGSSYVSTCVSATIFNYCTISRVLTDRTKAIFVIHTFCFPHPDLLALKKIAADRNIPLIEDCIAAFDSYNNENIRLGSIGDYAVYSLPKIMPLRYGGILCSRKNDVTGINDGYLSDEIDRWEMFLPEMKNRRKRNFSYLEGLFGHSVYPDTVNVNPYKYGFSSGKYNEIMQIPGVEFGKTHVKKEVHIPVNPFIDLSDYELLTGQC